MTQNRDGYSIPETGQPTQDRNAGSSQDGSKKPKGNSWVTVLQSSLHRTRRLGASRKKWNWQTVLKICACGTLHWEIFYRVVWDLKEIQELISKLKKIKQAVIYSRKTTQNKTKKCNTKIKM